MEAQSVQQTLDFAKNVVRSHPELAERVTDRVIEQVTGKLPIPGFARRTVAKVLDMLLPDIFIDSLRDVVVDAVTSGELADIANPDGESK